MRIKKLATLFKRIIGEIGDDPEREGLLNTPERAAKAYQEMFKGYYKSTKPKITCFKNGTDGFTYTQMEVDEGSFHSFCEHHLLPFFGKYWFAYIPHEKGRILGLSKVARIVDYYSAKLQIQERLVQEVVNELWNALTIEIDLDGVKREFPPPVGMALVMKGTHLCKSMRGVRKEGQMTTIEVQGAFKDQPETRAEFLKFVNGGK